jgi:hypothetical protein
MTPNECEAKYDTACNPPFALVLVIARWLVDLRQRVGRRWPCNSFLYHKQRV